jgi:hypothetical protein
MRPPTTRIPRTFALGAWLATRGALAATGFVLAGVGAIAAAVASLAVARHGTSRQAAQMPVLAAEGIAWSAGITLAFGAALRAVHRDREQGVLALVRGRGASIEAYVRGRVGGLMFVLAATVGGATFVAALAATSAGGASPAAAARACAAALAYALAFSVTMGPVAMAALGGRTRAGGYATLLAVLAVPELLSPWTSALLPRGWHELTSIPAALDAVRAGVMGPLGAAARAARAAAGLASVIAISLVVVAVRVGRAEREHAS